MRAQAAPESVQARTSPRAQASTHLGEASRAQPRSGEHGVVGAPHPPRAPEPLTAVNEE